MSPVPRRPRHLQLVDAGSSGRVAAAGAAVDGERAWSTPVVVRAGNRVGTRRRRRASAAVRRQRLVVAVAAAALVLLALPLRSIGGSPVPSAVAAMSGRLSPVTYVVRPGDTLWTIAERVDPSGDPRPLVAWLAAQVGSDTIVPGEQLRLP
ncbi:MAG: LysM peptidoglycan-binding domain-containing protein [Acidimicrobiales bacterium]